MISLKVLRNGKWVFSAFVVLSLLPLVLCYIRPGFGMTMSQVHQSVSPPVIPPRKLFHNSGVFPIPQVPMTLVIPCQTEDFQFLPALLESVANQTVLPYETILVLNIPPDSSEGVPLFTFDYNPLHINEVISEAVSNATDESHETESLSVKDSLRNVLKSRAPLDRTVAQIPNLRFMVRAGKHFAGNNRMYGARAAMEESTFLSFFDCDDYLHPQRTEYVYRAFQENPELEALIHGFKLLPITKWAAEFDAFLEPVEFMPENRTFLWTYQTIHEQLPVDVFKHEIDGEPKQTKDSLWFFPRKMKLPRFPPYPTMGHNGWLTVKKEVLAEIPYPESLPRGQDSLYNWRLLSSRRNWNHLPLRLAAYVRLR